MRAIDRLVARIKIVQHLDDKQIAAALRIIGALESSRIYDSQRRRDTEALKRVSVLAEQIARTGEMGRTPDELVAMDYLIESGAASPAGNGWSLLNIERALKRINDKFDNERLLIELGDHFVRRHPPPADGGVS